eukprot:RCo022890
MAFVAGVGMTKFVKPGGPRDYPELVYEAVTKALHDSGLSYSDVQAAFVGHVFGPSTSAQRALYTVGMTGIPIVATHNNCATGSAALMLARQAILSGSVDVVLAVGFEKMQKGALGMGADASSPHPFDWQFGLTNDLVGFDLAVPAMPQQFGHAAREHMRRHGSTKTHFAKVGWKNHRHSVHNPYSQFRQEFSLEQVEQSREVFAPLTLLQCSPTSDGAAAAVLVSKAFLARRPS